MNRVFRAEDLHGFSVKIKTKGQAWDGCPGSDELLVRFNAKLAPLVGRLEQMSLALESLKDVKTASDVLDLQSKYIHESHYAVAAYRALKGTK